MNPWRSLRGLPRPLYILAAATMVNRAGTMVLPFLVLYLTRSVGLSAELAGGILAAYGIAALVAAPLAGWLCDRIGAARVATGSLLSSSVVFALYPLAQSPTAIIVASAVLALLGEGFRPASMTLCGQLAPATQKKTAFALQRLAINLGMSVGPAVGGVLATVWFPAIFLADGATSLVGGLVLAFALRGRRGPDDHPVETGEHADTGRRAYRDLGYLYCLVAVLFVSFVFFQIDAALPLYMVRELSMSESSFGLLFTVNTGLIIAVEVPLNAATAHWSARRAMALGAALCGIGMGCVALATGFVTLAITVVIWTFGEMILFPSSSAYVSDIAPPGRSGEYMGLYSMTFGLGFSVGPWAGVALMERAGANVLWLIVLGTGLISALMFLFVRRTETESPPADDGG